MTLANQIRGRGTIGLALLFGLVNVLNAQPPAPVPPATGPIATVNAKDIPALATAFEQELAQAVLKKLDPKSIERAKQLADQAKTAEAAKDFAEAARRYRDARWTLPMIPAMLPPFVDRVYGQTRLKHGGRVSQVSVSPDGKRVATASVDGTVKIWDLANGHELRTYRKHTSAVNAVVWTPDGKTIVSAGGNNNNAIRNAFVQENNAGEETGEIHVWNAETGELIRTVGTFKRPIRALSMRPDGLAFAAAGDDMVLRIWKIADASELVNIGGQGGMINAIAFHPKGEIIASVNSEGNLSVHRTSPDAKNRTLVSIKLFNKAFAVEFAPDNSVGSNLIVCGDKQTILVQGPTATGEIGATNGRKIRSFDGIIDQVNAVAVSKDGQFVATGGQDRIVRVWDLASGRVIRTFSGHLDQIESLDFTPDGRWLLSGSLDQNIRLWDLAPIDQHRTLIGHTGPVWSAIVSPDGTLVASASADRTIRLWNFNDGKLVRTLTGHTAPITAIAFSPDGKNLISAAGDRLLKLWDVATGKSIRDFAGHENAVLAVVFSADGKQVLSGGADKQVKLWTIADGKAIGTWADQPAAVSSVALRADGKQAAIGCADGTLRMFDLTGPGRELNRRTAHAVGVGAVVYHPNGQMLASGGGDRAVKLWTIAADGQLTAMPELNGHEGPVSSVAFSPDGKTLASSGGDQTVKVWSVDTRRELRTLRGHTDWVGSIAFHPLGRGLVSASVDQSVKLWELRSEETIAPIGHIQRVLMLAVSMDGTTLASGSEDGTIKIWDIATGQERFTLMPANAGNKEENPNLGLTGAIIAVSFSPDGKRLVTGGRDQRIRIWDLTTRRELVTMESLGGSLPLIDCLPDNERFLVWLNKSDANGISTHIALYDYAGKLKSEVVDRDLQVHCMTHSLDGKIVVLGNQSGVVRVYDLATGKAIGGDLPVDKQLADMAITPDQKRLITVAPSGEAKIWDLSKREVIKTLKFHGKDFLTLFTSRDSQKLVTLDKHGEVKAWNIADGSEIRTWKLPVEVILATFTPDGKSIITANEDSTLTRLAMP